MRNAMLASESPPERALVGKRGPENQARLVMEKTPGGLWSMWFRMRTACPCGCRWRRWNKDRRFVVLYVRRKAGWNSKNIALRGGCP